jgi:hypothetical protein
MVIRTKNLDGDPKMKVVEFLEDESIFGSIVNSKRRIENLKLVRLNLDPSNIEKLQAILENIGARIEELIVSGGSLSRPELALFNLMPQLEYIQLDSVLPKNLGSLRNFRLNLSELTKIKIHKCAEKVLEIFDQLPDDVLEEVELSYIKAESSRKYLRNQRMVKALYFASCSFNPLEMEQLNLEELETDLAGEELNLILKKQASLKYLFVVSEIAQSDFNFICSHLPSLDQFELFDSKNINDFSELASLEQLVMFKTLLADDAVQSIKSSSVETLEIDLEIEIVSEETVIALAANCPSVVNLYINSEDDDAISWCLKNFTQLKTFSCSSIYDEYIFPHNLKHLNLKELEVSMFERSLNLLFLFQCLENLEIFKTEQKIDWQDLQMILGAKKLKALCFKSFIVLDKEFVKTLKMLGKNLESFHAQELYEVEDSLSPEELREEFKEHFPIFSLRSGKKWLMKKSNKPKICCDE